MKKLSLLLLALSFISKANAVEFSISASNIKVAKATSTTLSKGILNQRIAGFSTVTVEGFENDRNIGAPSLPVKSVLLQGTPEQIQVALFTKTQEVLSNTKPIPVQEDDCRCATQKVRTFQYNAGLYQSQSAYTLTYLGAFRGTPITRLDVRVATYDASKNQVTVNTQMHAQVNVPEYSYQGGDYKDYLIVTTQNLKSGLDEFVNWKRSQGFNVNVETVSSPTLASVSELVKKYYANGVDFVIFVGDSSAIPMYTVSTSGSSQTPTDIKYFTLDGANDYIPDVFYSRIVAASAAQVAKELNKASEFEQKSAQDQSGFRKIIGIASNEGAGPSDDEYVKGIENNFKSVLGVEATHFYQDDANSNPQDLNAAFSAGAFWLTYLGHGSGQDWASMGTWYNISDVSGMRNVNQVKPVVIDVACMNGVIEEGYLGSTLMNVNGESAGVAAYYGGTVNISWHPPAVMAQGIASEHLSKKFKHIGEALFAGQLYLAAKWNNKNDVIDNFEWYHLQGDPGMSVEFQ